jgi:hypothetical protein
MQELDISSIKYVLLDFVKVGETELESSFLLSFIDNESINLIQIWH